MKINIRSAKTVYKYNCFSNENDYPLENNTKCASIPRNSSYEAGVICQSGSYVFLCSVITPENHNSPNGEIILDLTISNLTLEQALKLLFFYLEKPQEFNASIIEYSQPSKTNSDPPNGKNSLVEKISTIFSQETSQQAKEIQSKFNEEEKVEDGLIVVVCSRKDLPETIRFHLEKSDGTIKIKELPKKNIPPVKDDPSKKVRNDSNKKQLDSSNTENRHHNDDDSSLKSTEFPPNSQPPKEHQDKLDHEETNKDDPDKKESNDESDKEDGNDSNRKHPDSSNTENRQNNDDDFPIKIFIRSAGNIRKYDYSWIGDDTPPENIDYYITSIRGISDEDLSACIIRDGSLYNFLCCGLDTEEIDFSDRKILLDLCVTGLPLETAKTLFYSYLSNPTKFTKKIIDDWKLQEETPGWAYNINSLRNKIRENNHTQQFGITPKFYSTSNDLGNFDKTGQNNGIIIVGFSGKYFGETNCYRVDCSFNNIKTNYPDTKNRKNNKLKELFENFLEKIGSKKSIENRKKKSE